MATQTHMTDTTMTRTIWMIIGLAVAAILAYAAYSYYRDGSMNDATYTTAPVTSGTATDNTAAPAGDANR